MNVRYYRCLYYFLFLYQPPPPFSFDQVHRPNMKYLPRPECLFFFFSLQTMCYCGLCDVLLSSSGKYLTTIYSGNFTSFTIPSHIYAFSVHAQKSIQIFPLWHGMVTIVFVFGHRSSSTADYFVNNWCEVPGFCLLSVCNFHNDVILIAE